MVHARFPGKGESSRINGLERKGGYIDTGRSDPDGYTLCTAIGATFPMEYQVDANKHIHKLLSPVLKPSRTYSFVITF